MMTILIMLTIFSIVIPTIATIEWVKYMSEEDMEFIYSITPTVESSKETPSAIRRYKSDYIDTLESEADVRMKQANMFYEMGVQW